MGVEGGHGNVNMEREGYIWRDREIPGKEDEAIKDIRCLQQS